MTGTTISTLPNEVLEHVFGFLDDGDVPKIQRLRYLQSLPLVSRQWNSLSTPILYSRLDVFFSGHSTSKYLEKKRSKGERLCRTLDTHPVLLSYVKDLDVVVYEDTSAALDLLTQASSSIRHLSIRGTQDTAFMKRVASIISTMDLVSLHLSGEQTTAIINHLLRHKSQNSLLELSIQTYEKTPKPHLSKIKTDQQYTSPIESLVFRAKYWSLEALQTMVLWPRCLKFLSLDMSESWYVYMYELDAHFTRNIQRVLDLQRDNLETIQLAEYLEDEQGVSVDLSAFPNLKSLTTHMNNLFRMSPEDAVRRLSAPNLERICIDVRWNDQQCYGYEQLSDENANWLAEFVSRRQQHLPTNNLREIYVIHLMRDGSFYQNDLPGYIHDGESPKECFEKYASRLGSLGVKLSWPTINSDEEDHGYNSWRRNYS